MLSLILVTLVFIWKLATQPQGQMYLDRSVDWDLTADFANTINEDLDHGVSTCMMAFKTLVPTKDGPIPEDFLLRGQAWAEGIFPPTGFDSLPIDIDERTIERDYFTQTRKYRIKWLLGGIAQSKKYDNSHSTPVKRPTSGQRPATSGSWQRRWLHYDAESDTFSVVDYVDDEADSASAKSRSSADDAMSGVEST